LIGTLHFYKNGELFCSKVSSAFIDWTFSNLQYINLGQVPGLAGWGTWTSRATVELHNKAFNETEMADKYTNALTDMKDLF
jgi:hypothetical protein